MPANTRATVTLTLITVFCLPARRGWAQNGSMASLLEADRSTAERSERDGVAVALKASLAADGVVLWPGAPIVAEQDAVSRLLAGVRSDSSTFTWQPLAAERSADSSLGLTWGVSVRASRNASGTSPVVFGRYVAAWRREASGWRLAAVAFTGAAVPPAAVPTGLPVQLPPLAPAGKTGPFVSADLAFARLAADSGAAIAFERWAAPGAVLPGGLLTFGPSAIGRAIASGGPATWRWHPVLAGTTPAGDFGFTVGEATITPDTGNPAYSKYLTVWRRLADGSIRFIADGGNPRPRAPSRP
jgi:ketosteroid isomerase-like protein